MRMTSVNRLAGAVVCASSAAALVTAGLGLAADLPQVAVEEFSDNFQRLADENGVGLRTLEYLRSEPVADPRIAAAIRAAHPEYANVSAEEIAAGVIAPRYFFNWLDLNGDGDREVFAYIVGPSCGSGGCPALILASQADGYRIVGDLVGVETPVVVGQAAAGDWRKLLLVRPEAGTPDEVFSVLTFEGEGYAEAPASLAEAQTTEWRTAVISERIRWDTPGHPLAGPASPDLGKGGCLGSNEADDMSIGGISIGASGDEVRQLLGAPAAVSERRLWGADALEHQQWDYPEAGVSVSLAFEDATHPGRVERVEVGPPSSLKTVCGIGIGSTERDVSAAYGEGSGDGVSRTIGDHQAGLAFVLKGGQVVMMRLGPASE